MRRRSKTLIAFDAKVTLAADKVAQYERSLEMARAHLNGLLDARTVFETAGLRKSAGLGPVPAPVKVKGGAA